MRQGLLLLFSFFIITGVKANVVDNMLASYEAAGASNFSVAAGKAMWHKDFPDKKKPGKVRNCSTCHGEDMTQKGKHAKTGKVIDPIAPSANAERLTDSKFVAKWFKRNCKWVLGRKCTAQEKGNFLVYLRKQ